MFSYLQAPDQAARMGTGIITAEVTMVVTKGVTKGVTKEVTKGVTKEVTEVWAPRSERCSTSSS